MTERCITCGKWLNCDHGKAREEMKSLRKERDDMTKELVDTIKLASRQKGRIEELEGNLEDAQKLYRKQTGCLAETETKLKIERKANAGLRIQNRDCWKRIKELERLEIERAECCIENERLAKERLERIKELEEGLISIKERLYPSSLGEYDWVEAQDIISKLLEKEQEKGK